jgi:nitrate/TMAO reductase-like tetraheme cytochrome c subunit
MTFDEAKVYVKEQSTAQFEFPTNIISAVYEVLSSHISSIEEHGITADECDTMISDAWNRMQ